MFRLLPKQPRSYRQIKKLLNYPEICFMAREKVYSVSRRGGQSGYAVFFVSELEIKKHNIEFFKEIERVEVG